MDIPPSIHSNVQVSEVSDSEIAQFRNNLGRLEPAEPATAVVDDFVMRCQLCHWAYADVVTFPCCHVGKWNLLHN